MPKKITRKQAEAALAAVRRQFKSYLFDEAVQGPYLIKDYDSPVVDRTVPWVIAWDDYAPYEWAYNAKDGGLDEELSELAGQRVDTPEATGWPKGVWAEPHTSYVLSLHPED